MERSFCTLCLFVGLAAVSACGSSEGLDGDAVAGTGGGTQQPFPSTPAEDPAPTSPNHPVAGTPNDANAAPTVANFLTAGSRLTVPSRTGSDGSVATASMLFDPQTQQPCTVKLAADGKLRCLPVETIFSGHYLDSSCTKRAIALGCVPDKYPFYVSKQANLSGDDTEPYLVYRVTGPVDTANTFALDSADNFRCKPAVDIGIGVHDYLHASVAADTFVAFD